jgi:hypothetical protein
MTNRVLQAKADGVPPPATMGESFDGLAEAGRIAPDLARRLRDVEALAKALLSPPAAPA